jgi:hypothetical protein
MLQASRQLDLAKKALDAIAAAELRTHHLHRNGTFVPEIAGEIDGGHAAGADLTLHRISAAKSGAQALGDIAHR